MIEEGLELGVLQSAEEKDHWIRRRLPDHRLEGIDHRERIQRSRQDQTLGQSGGGVGPGELADPGRQLTVDRMIAHAPVPVAGIPEVGFAPVNDGVDQGSLGVDHVLDEVVCLVVVIVIEQTGSDDAIRGFRPQGQVPAQAAQAHLQRTARQDAQPGPLFEVRQFRRAQQIPKGRDALGRSGASHRENEADTPTQSSVRQTLAEIRPCRRLLLS